MSYTNLLYHIVRAYIRNQEKHHRKMSFEDEFKALLRAHGIDFDESHLWG